MGGTTAGEFRTLLDRLLREAEASGRDRIEVRAGDLHRTLGGYPGPTHRMPVCCEVMRGAMGAEDRIVQRPPKGNGASLTVSYKLPRRPSASHAPPPTRSAPWAASPSGITGLSSAFRPVAYWRLEDGRIEPHILPGPTVRSCIFIIVTGLEPHYVGKCEGDLLVRLAQIREPGSTQETHKRLNPLIREALARGQAVEVLAWQVPAHELTAQRDVLVQKLQPLWNSRR